MNKSELAQSIETKFNLHPLEAKKVTDIFFDSMTEHLKSGDRIEIRGFGNMVVKEYEPYVGRNPKTGEKVHVPQKKLPFWKTGKELKDRLNSK